MSHSKREETDSDRDAAELQRQRDTVAEAADAWARGAALAVLRRLSEATPGSWLHVEVPFSPNYRPPAAGLYRVMFGPDSDVDDADGVASFWHAVLGNDAGLLDDPAATLLFADRVREVYRDRLAAARG